METDIILLYYNIIFKLFNVISIIFVTKYPVHTIAKNVDINIVNNYNGIWK